jgi:hypothetical protein
MKHANFKKSMALITDQLLVINHIRFLFNKINAEWVKNKLMKNHFLRLKKKRL